MCNLQSQVTGACNKSNFWTDRAGHMQQLGRVQVMEPNCFLDQSRPFQVPLDLLWTIYTQKLPDQKAMLQDKPFLPTCLAVGKTLNEKPDLTPISLTAVV